ncbi:MAG: hypothetical protein F6K17_28950 [Okeania sp. SIO3C4]|nr:hypothetical protein [Okeania sp. SIO3C4]
MGRGPRYQVYLTVEQKDHKRKNLSKWLCASQKNSTRLNSSDVWRSCYNQENSE